MLDKVRRRHILARSVDVVRLQHQRFAEPPAENDTAPSVKPEPMPHAVAQVQGNVAEEDVGATGVGAAGVFFVVMKEAGWKP